MSKVMSTSKQRQMIGYFRKLLYLSEDVYRDVLWSWGVESSKDLTINQAETLLHQLKNQAVALGRYKPKVKYKAQKWKYNNYSDRDENMASPAQLRMVESIWLEVSYQTNDKDREAALNTLCERVTGKSRLIFLTKKDIRNLITVIKAMREEKYA